MAQPIENQDQARITLTMVRENRKVQTLITDANEVLRAMGYTEHGHRHAGIVSSITRYILENLGVIGREAELGQIAAYLHDIGNAINRQGHPMSGANLAYHLLTEMGMDIAEITPIIAAIGNHEELSGNPISRMSAALIIADKSDVHCSRVQETDLSKFDIHDRVNFAVKKSRVDMDRDERTIRLAIEIDQSFATVMEYFEIFLSRMVMCRASAKIFGYRFQLEANGTLLE
ncbi:MAG: HD domain-containing protein [Chthonomonas sp.]|nr:HD domain-containing protein [Chthonomonas sp.]